VSESRRRPLVSGNWKMHHDHLAAIRTVSDLGMRLEPDDVASTDVSVHPPFVDLRSVQTVLEDRGIPVALGAQHCYFEEEGAYTGEISPGMLESLGVTYVIVGHSERRRLFGQTDEQVHATVPAVLRHNMVPVVCVGEDEEERERRETDEVLSRQVTSALKGIPPAKVAGMVVAYEPVWAIGTGRTASADDAQSGCEHVRSVVGEVATEEASRSLRILYGGSVNPDTAPELASCKDVDGFLVGGSSLRASEFVAIIRATADANPRRGD
jgi:triosephosphate isomerase (TIM)